MKSYKGLATMPVSEVVGPNKLSLNKLVHSNYTRFGVCQYLSVPNNIDVMGLEWGISEGVEKEPKSNLTLPTSTRSISSAVTS